MLKQIFAPIHKHIKQLEDTLSYEAIVEQKKKEAEMLYKAISDIRKQDKQF